MILFNPSKGYKKLSDFVAWAKGQSRQGQLLVGRRRKFVPPQWRAVSSRRRLRCGALAVQGRTGGDDRSHRRTRGLLFLAVVNALPLMKDGQLQALAVSNSSRASGVADVPTVAEAGYPNSEYNFWAGVFVPARTPAAIKESSTPRSRRRSRRRMSATS